MQYLNKTVWVVFTACLAFVMALQGRVAFAADYCAWQAQGAAIEKPLCGLQGDAARGRDIVADGHRGNCLACHVMPIPEQPFHGTVGPALYAVGARLSAAEIRLRVVDEQQLNANTIMPPFYRDPKTLNQVSFDYDERTFLTAQQVEDVVAYLATLKEPAPP